MMPEGEHNLTNAFVLLDAASAVDARFLWHICSITVNQNDSRSVQVALIIIIIIVLLFYPLARVCCSRRYRRGSEKEIHRR